jgi:hypothetical protein
LGSHYSTPTSPHSTILPASSQSHSSTATHTSPPFRPSTKFYKFNDLPTELRQLIWRAALPPSRIVLLEHKKRKFDANIEEFIPRIDRLGFRTDAPNPSILLACREAYNVACFYFQRAFSNKTGTSIPEIYFDFANDFLYLGPEWVGPGESSRCYQERITYVLANELHPYDLSHVENLAIWWDNEHAGTNPIAKYIASILCHFGSVKHVTIVSKIYRSAKSSHASSKTHADLKFLDGTTSPSADIEARGLPLPGSSSYLPRSRVDLGLLRVFSSRSGELPHSPKEWKVPTIEYNVITTPEGEKTLLEAAEIAKEIGVPIALIK